MYILQIEGADTLLTTIIILVISILITVVILRWVFKIDEHIRNQQAIIWLLIKLSAKSGVEKEELDKIIKAFKIK